MACCASASSGSRNASWPGGPPGSAASRSPGPPRAGRRPPGRPICCATWSTWLSHCRTWASGRAPRNPGTSWPPITPTTIGMLCTCSAALSWGLASTSTLASTQAPAASSASRSSTGLSCLQGPHHSAHRSMITGTVRERSSTSVSNVASVTSNTYSLCGAPWLAAAEACWRCEAAWRAPRSTAPYSEKFRCCMTPSCRIRHRAWPGRRPPARWAPARPGRARLRSGYRRGPKPRDE